MASTRSSEITTDTTPPERAADLRGLQRLLGSRETQTFVKTHLGQRMLWTQGDAGRWADLFSWQELDTLLNSGLLCHPRARLVMHGAGVPEADYVHGPGTSNALDSHRCHALMASGASLIVMRLEAVNPRLNAFVRDLERDLRSRVRVDVVATTATVPGLKMHWDNAECFNLQLSGEKDWQVVEPERHHPLTATAGFPSRLDVVPVGQPPDKAPMWSGTVTAGDLIYLPRGWWHLVTPKVSPSLHLSVAVEVPTLTDYLRWLAHDAARHETARRPIPVWLDEEERQARMAEALAELRGLLSRESIESYLTGTLDLSWPRPSFDLLGAAAPEGPRVERDTVLRLESIRPLTWTLSDGFVILPWRGETLKFSEQLLPALQRLNERRSLTLDELGAGMDRILARVLAFTLLTSGLVSTVRPR